MAKCHAALSVFLSLRLHPVGSLPPASGSTSHTPLQKTQAIGNLARLKQSNLNRCLYVDLVSRGLDHVAVLFGGSEAFPRSRTDLAGLYPQAPGQSI